MTVVACHQRWQLLAGRPHHFFIHKLIAEQRNVARTLVLLLTPDRAYELRVVVVRVIRRRQEDIDHRETA